VYPSGTKQTDIRLPHPSPIRSVRRRGARPARAPLTSLDVEDGEKPFPPLATPRDKVRTEAAIGANSHTGARSLENPAKRGHSEDFNARRKGADTLEVKDDVGEWLSLIDEAKKDARDYHKTCERIRKRDRYARPHADAPPRARRIAAPNGLSHHERDLLTEGLDHLRRGPCVFVSIAAGRSPDAEKKVRALARKVKSDIALRQRRPAPPSATSIRASSPQPRLSPSR